LSKRRLRLLQNLIYMQSRFRCEISSLNFIPSRTLPCLCLIFFVVMKLKKISLHDTHSFSPFFLDYINGEGKLKTFYNLFPTIENVGKQIEAKSAFAPGARKILTTVLNKQYQSLTITDRVRENITSLESSKTFTVTTGHQLNIFTGPLYFIYKITTIINACRTLRERYPGYSFVPVYWMASEDHDFEEISYFRLYGKKYSWQTKQTGAVGRFNPVSMREILNDVPGDIGVFREAYLEHTSLSDAVRFYMNELFGTDGLVVLNADDRALKNQLRHVMQEDLFDSITRKLVDEDTLRLKALGYHAQVNARDINFFFLDTDIRDRIERDGQRFKVVDQEMSWKDSEVRNLIEYEPEKFSPNVLLRPLYQEIILPNLAYIGGPSEVVYWLQLKSVFAHFKIPFPILMPRNFATVMDAPVIRRFEKTGLEIKDLFEEKNYLFNHWTLKNSSQDLSLNAFMENARSIFDEIRKQAGKIDSTLEPHVAAKSKQTVHQLEIIEKKMLRAEKRRYTEKLRQVEMVKDTLFPGGSLQERTDNFLNFFQQNPRFIKDLVDTFDPFDYLMHVLMYHD
jgi:bacillithiol biosynthesis cysteine-adding enzyme BshC